MSKRYMDFAPRNVKSAKVVAKKATAKTVKPTESVSVAKATKTTVRAPRVVRVAKPAQTKVTVARAPGGARIIRTERPAQKKVSFGVVEDVAPKFVRTNVPKRPLSEKPHFTTQSEIARIKAEKIRLARRNSARADKLPVEKPVENSLRSSSDSAKKVDYNVPRTPFINQDKVEKRPLSKNVYQKRELEPVKEEAKEPVTIIAKPEKDSRVGVIVTIIVTIILGAAAGTVAFLLLPK